MKDGGRMDVQTTREAIRETLTLMSLDPDIERIKQKPEHRDMINSVNRSILGMNDVDDWHQITSARLWGQMISSFSVVGLIKQGMEENPFSAIRDHEVIMILLMSQVLSLHVISEELASRGDL